ncbi:MAG: epimerase [Sandaracinus sp.]|nr:epimerase [Sandaracinus sp.]|tara:strand:+ start:225 stop:1058 length:834 start_codon:yes stop_codon:yes gene_type:complete
MKSILLTGATGKVGSRLLPFLVSRGHRVRALVRDLERAAPLRGDGVELVLGDLLDEASLAAAARGVDTVVHCAAFFRGATPEEAHAVNEGGTRHLADAARAAGVERFVFISTGLVYGPKGGRQVDEDTECAPVDAYPLSKLAAERFLLALPDLDVRILRLPFVYGDGDPHIAEAVPFMKAFPAEQRLAIAHHADVAQAVALVVEAPSLAHRVYDVVDDEAPDHATLLAAVGAPPPDGSERERARSFDVLPVGRRLREELGFRPRYPRLADAIAAEAL